MIRLITLVRMAALVVCPVLVLALIAGCTSTSDPIQTAVKGTPPGLSPEDIGPLISARAEPKDLAPPQPRIVGSGENVIAIYPCRYQAPEDLRQVVMGLVTMEGSVEAGMNLNTLIISETEERAIQLLELLKELDRPRRQLLVEARVVELTLDKDFEAELQYIFSSGPGTFLQGSEITLDTPSSSALETQGLLLNLLPIQSGDDKALDAFVRLLLERANGKILSSPNVLVTEGTQAFIHTGEELPIFSTTTSGGTVQVSNEFKPVGVKLRVRPIRVTGDAVELEIQPEVSAVTGFKTGPQGSSAPVVAQRQVQATLRMRDGEIITIGGLLQQESRQTNREIPGLGKIPILGNLFKSRRDEQSRTHLIFFLRVHILPEGRPNTARVHKPGSGLEPLEMDGVLTNGEDDTSE
ncbi:MAG: hypothetical protein K9N51_07685 [Candidatus Pacebacteria bacterium]|nr:hypothetical protein [Candidatus Paceibacterota bacterium]